MHFFWGGDMPHYSPPLPFRRGRAGARACWPARGAPGSGVAVLRAVWRVDWDSNPGCNCLVRGYSPSMHFFWPGDMQAGVPVRAGQPAGAPGSGVGHARWLACPGPRPRTRLAVTALRFSPFFAPLCGVFQFLDRYISLARKIGYVTIKPMTNTARYLCFSWLMCNRREKAAWPAITVLRFEKNRSSGNVQKGQNFGLALNIGPAFSDRFQVLTAI